MSERNRNNENFDDDDRDMDDMTNEEKDTPRKGGTHGGMGSGIHKDTGTGGENRMGGQHGGAGQRQNPPQKKK